MSESLTRGPFCQDTEAKLPVAFSRETGYNRVITGETVPGPERSWDHMELRDGMFAVKLEELDRQYGRLQSRL